MKKDVDPKQSLTISRFLKITFLSFFVGIFNEIININPDFGIGDPNAIIFGFILFIIITLINIIIVSSLIIICIMLLFVFKKNNVSTNFLASAFIILSLIVLMFAPKVFNI